MLFSRFLCYNNVNDVGYVVWQVRCRCDAMLHLFKTTTREVQVLRQQIKKNKIRSLSDASQAIYPRQPLIAAVDDSRTNATDDRSQSLVNDRLTSSRQR